MLELLKERKAALEAQGKKGFTLMEMLIVIAIIAILIAIAIPIFTSQLENSRDATSVANMRSAYAEAQAAYLTGKSGTQTDNANVTVKTTNGAVSSVEVANVRIETQVANTWSGMAAELPWNQGKAEADITPADPGTAGTKTLVFTYENGGLKSVGFAS